LNRPINGIVTPGLERIQDVKTLAYLTAPVAYGLHSFAPVFVDGFGFALDDWLFSSPDYGGRGMKFRMEWREE
jgi:hypothetical protein